MAYQPSIQHQESPLPLSSRSGKRSTAKKMCMSLDAFVSQVYLPHAKQYKSSWDVDERNFRLHVSPIIGELQLNDITRRDVAAWFRGLSEKGLAPGTCDRILASLKSICALALEYNLFPSGQCPSDKISPLKIQGVRERYLTDAQAIQVMHELDCSEQPEAKIVKLLILTGARKSEIRKARWEHVHLEQRLLTVPVSKSGKARHIPLSNEAVEVFRSIPQVKGCPWVFPGHAPGKPISDIFLFWNSLRRKLGLQGIRVHDLRHTFASLLVNAGHTLYEVQMLLGHSDPRTTMRYAHLGQNALLAVAQTVSDRLARGRRAGSGRPALMPMGNRPRGGNRASPMQDNARQGTNESENRRRGGREI